MIRICIVGDIGSGKSYVAKQFRYPVYNAIKDTFKNPFEPSESAIWLYGNFSGKKGWKEGATMIATFTIKGVPSLYIKLINHLQFGIKLCQKLMMRQLSY